MTIAPDSGKYIRDLANYFITYNCFLKTEHPVASKLKGA